MKLTVQQFARAVPHASDAIIFPLVDDWNMMAEHYGVKTVNQTAYFLGRAGVETWGFTRLDENLYYTKASTIRKTWPTRFATDADAQPYVGNPHALANKVYNGRLGNKPAGDDGWNYRGSGILQTTGLANFADVRDMAAIDCVNEPELLRKFPHALEAALIYWQRNDCNKYANTGDVTGLVKAIQGGSAGLSDTVHYIDAFLAVLTEPVHARPVLRYGMRDTLVTGPVHELQSMLSPDFYGSANDGIFGPGTQNAVKEFQRSRGLVPVDGIVGPMTWKELDK